MNPNEIAFFWFTGILSAFLDNAPTYLVFFELAGGDAATLMGPLAGTLEPHSRAGTARARTRAGTIRMRKAFRIAAL